MQIPQAITRMTLNLQLGPLAFTMMMAGLFVILGMFFEAVIIHYVCLPLFLPAITMLNIDLIPLGIMLVANLMIGNITPPVGVTLYAACSATDTSPLTVAKESIPFLIAVCLGMLLIILFPAFSSFLPNLMFK
jgi:C4-dicarboxylate transporter DctM subunit